MKVTITGPLGRISKPLTKELVRKGHQVTVTGSDPEKQKEIEAMGARAAIGFLEHGDFLTSSFANAGMIYSYRLV